jgi:hypothetical protein
MGKELFTVPNSTQLFATPEYSPVPTRKERGQMDITSEQVANRIIELEQSLRATRERVYLLRELLGDEIEKYAIITYKTEEYSTKPD